MKGIKALTSRALSQSAVRASGVPGAKDDPKFYAMVLQFTESAADILEQRLLDDTKVELGRHEAVKRAMLEKANRSAEQKKKEIQGYPNQLFHFFNYLVQAFLTLCFHANQFLKPIFGSEWTMAP